MPLLIAVVAGDLGTALAMRTSPTSRVGYVNTGCWDGLPPSLLSVSTMLLLLLLLPSLLVGSLAIFGTLGVWALRILSWCSLGGLVPKVPSSRPGTWPRWYELDSYLVDNADLSLGGWRGAGGWSLLQHRLLFHLTPPNCLSLDQRLEPLSEVSNESGLFWSPVSIKLNKDGLKMFEVGRLILNFLLLVQDFFEKKLWTRPKARKLRLLTLVLVPTKVDPTMKEQSCKRGMVEAGSASSSKIILTLLTKVVAFYVRLSIIEIREPSL